MMSSSHQHSIKLLQRCPSCKGTIPNHRINVIEETDQALVAHLACQSCLSNYITHVVHNAQGLIGNAILTDLDYSETMRALENRSFTDDEILSLIQLIERRDFLEKIYQDQRSSNQK